MPLGVPTVVVLYARSDSIYYTDPRCEPWDIVKDASTWPLGCPVVAHPPCRAWGRLRSFAKPRPGEKELALKAVNAIRNCGGVLEHPAASSLWAAAGLPKPGGGVDAFGGFTVQADQQRWGHRAEKQTWFYVCGLRGPMLELPPAPTTRASHVITNVPGIRKGDPRWRPEVGKREREATPPALAKWLVDLAERCGPPALLQDLP